MEIQGVSGVQTTGQIVIKKMVPLEDGTMKEREFTLTFQALPMGFHEQNEKMWPSPKPPKKGFVRGKSGKWIRDPRTGQPIIEYNYDDQKYKDEVTIINRVHTMRMVNHAWIEYDKIAMETKRESFPDGPEGEGKYLLKLWDELHDWGFTTGDYARLIQGILKLSQVDDKEVTEVTENDFLFEDAKVMLEP